MKTERRDRFIALWQEYFPNAELPLAFYYTDEGPGKKAGGGRGTPCVIAHLARAMKGEPLWLDAETIGCPGGRRYLGFAQELMPGFEHFLSCGIPGKMEGEHYKQSPDLVRAYQAHNPVRPAPADYAVCKPVSALFGVTLTPARGLRARRW